MVNAIRLVKIDFDNLENHNAICSEDLGVFVDGDNLTAHGKVKEFIRKMQPVKPYLGWNGQVYPQFRLEKIDLQ